MKVNNIPEYAREFDYTVVRMVCGEAWYYGSWSKFDKAARQAAECGGHVIPTCEIDTPEGA